MMVDAIEGIFADHELENYEDNLWLNTVQPARIHEIEMDISVVPPILPLGDQAPKIPVVLSSQSDGGWASKDDWPRAQAMIKRLYVDEDKTLKQVMTAVEKEYGMKATPKMYKDRIKKWGLDKNNKEHELAALLRKKQERDSVGKQSVLRVRDRTMRLQDIHRYCQRKGVTLAQLSTRYTRASTPPGISCASPEPFTSSAIKIPRSMTTPGSLAVSEQLFFNINRYMSVSFSSGTWITLEDESVINTKYSGDPEIAASFSHYCSMGLEFFRAKSFVEGRRAISRASGLVQGMIKGENPLTMEILVDTLARLSDGHLPEIVTALIAYISQMASFLLDTEHPLGIFCKLLDSMDPNCLVETLTQCWGCINKVYVQYLGELHGRSLESEMSRILLTSSKDDLVDSERRLRKFHGQIRERDGPSARSLYQVAQALWSNLCDQEKYSEAESEACELVNNARESANGLYEVMGFVLVAHTQFNQGKLDLAEQNIMRAIESLGSNFEASDGLTLHMMVLSQRFLHLFGFERKAAELNPEIERRMMLAGMDDEL